MSINASFPAEVHLNVSNKWLNDYASTDAYVDCRHLDSTDGGRVMRPRGVLIGSNSDGTSTTSVIKGVLWSENHNQADTYRVVHGIPIALAFKFIYAKETSSRDIRVLG